ncbi:MAG: universal stress protein [Halarcobacter sp.]
MIIKKNIVVGIDLSKSSLEVLKRAFQLAKLKDAKLTIVHAIDKGLFDMYFSEFNNDELIEKAKKEIEVKIDKLQEINVEYSMLVKIITPVNLIVETVKEIKTDLIVIGVNSVDDFNTKIFGSTSIKTIQNTKLPVLIVKNNCLDEYKNILAFTDLSEVSVKSIKFTQDFFVNSKIKVIHAYKQLNDFVLTFYNSIEAKKKIQKNIVEKAEKQFDEFKEENKIVDGELIEIYHGVSAVLLNKANEENKDLVVLGSNGVNNAGSFLYGSTALYMIENVKNDILVYVPNEI